jgi:hypothetical protein
MLGTIFRQYSATNGFTDLISKIITRAQNLISARKWEFESPRGHQFKKKKARNAVPIFFVDVASAI